MAFNIRMGLPEMEAFWNASSNYPGFPPPSLRAKRNSKNGNYQ
jgi:hypothetical protein